MAQLILRNIDLSLGAGKDRRPVLQNLSINFQSGEMTCVTGPSGSGKTTLLSVLSLIVSPDAGTITYDDQILTTLTQSARARFRSERYALIFQTMRLIAVFTVQEHIAHVARTKADPRAVRRAGHNLLVKAGMASDLDSLPRVLSGGEKQRAALAVALCAAPPIVLADEPTAALDEANSLFVANTLRNYAECGAIVIAVSHDPTLFGAAHSVHQMRKT